MSQVTISYDNADREFRFDEPIRWAMNRWGGEETDSGQYLETPMRDITFAFEDEGNDSAALEDLAEILGDRFEEITYTGRPVEPESTDPVSDFDQPPLLPECPSILMFDRYAGLKHRDAIGPRSAEEVFCSYSDRLGWDLEMQANVLANWFGEGMIWPLLELVQQEAQVDDFAEFLAGTFGDDQHRN